MSDQFLKTRNEVENWLNKMAIKNYTIHDDLVVDVKGRVDLAYKNIQLLPVQFGHITEKFHAPSCGLTSLKGIAHTIDNDCILSNNKLKSLEFCPKFVRHVFNCNKNQITSLKYCENLNYLSFDYNKLSNLDFCPQNSAEYSFSNNQITCLKGLPDEIDGHLDIENNPITSFKNLPKRIGQSLVCGNDLILNAKDAPEFIRHEFMIKGKINFNILDLKTQCRTFTHECEEDDRIYFFSHLYEKKFSSYILKIPFSFLKKMEHTCYLEKELIENINKNPLLKI